MDLYLDYNATTPPDPEVVEAVLPYLGGQFGNAASAHARGRAAQTAVDTAAELVAALLGGAPSRLIWTSGATEALNQALWSVAVSGSMRERRKLVYAAGEHKAVVDTLAAIGDQLGIKSVEVPLTAWGEVNYEALEELVDEETAAVAVMAANNETGVRNDVGRVADIVHKMGSLYICDATQQAGKLEFDLHATGVDVACISAHKFYGLQGMGALLFDPQARSWLWPLIHGGGHQDGLRSGTINLPGVVGLGAAARRAQAALAEGEADRQRGLRDYLEQLLEARVGGIDVHGRAEQRLPNTLNLRIAGVEADALIVNCPDVAMSSGSACTSAVPTTSHVLRAMGIDHAEADESVRLSLGRPTTQDTVETAVDRISSAAERLRGML
jgi:cysteine desulfurase